MIIAIVGTYNDNKIGSIRGNGKTMTAVYLAYQNYQNNQKIYTNFKTTFGKMMTLNELVEMFRKKDLHDVTIIIDEAQIYLMNAGTKAKTLKEVINLFIAQTRKRNIDIILTSQRFLNLHKQLRLHCEIILIPIKYHLNEKNQLTTLCQLDNCKKSHAICIYNVFTEEYLPFILNPIEIGKLYNSNEIVLDEYKLKEKVEK